MKLVKYELGNEDLLRIWNDCYTNNPFLFPYSSINYTQISHHCFKFKTTKWKESHVFYVLYDEEVPQLILPITRYKDQLHLFSDDSQCGALDFIYAKHLDKNYFKQVFILLKQHFPRYKFHINKVNERSKLAQYLLKDTEQQARITEKRTCVAINFGDNIDEYYHSLSKSTRQNLRTSFNKLIKNENTYSLKLCMGKNIDNKLLKEQLKLYNMIWAAPPIIIIVFLLISKIQGITAHLILSMSKIAIRIPAIPKGGAL